MSCLAPSLLEHEWGMRDLTLQLLRPCSSTLPYLEIPHPHFPCLGCIRLTMHMISPLALSYLPSVELN